MGPTSFPGYLVRFAIAVVTCVPSYLLGTLVGLFDRKTGTRILRGWNRFFLWLFHITLTVEDRNPPGSLHGCVFVVLNQSSLLDTLLADTVVPLPLSGVINIEFALIPFFGWFSFVFSWGDRAAVALAGQKGFTEDIGISLGRGGTSSFRSRESGPGTGHYLPIKRDPS